MPRELKVLQMITRLIVGGAQEHALSLAVGQHGTPGMRVTLLAGPPEGPEGDLLDAARAAGLDLVVLPELVRPIRPATDAAAFARLVAFIRRGRFDVVHTHSSKAGILGRLAARAAGTPVVVHTLHSLVFGPQATRAEKIAYTAAERVTAWATDLIMDVSNETRRGALEAGVGRPAQHETIYSGFPIEPFLRIRDTLSVEEAKRRLGLPPDALVVGKVARLFHQKGHEYVIEAARIVCAKEPRARFVFVGDGVLRGEYEARVRELGLADRFVFTGLLPPEDVPAAMQAMDIKVLTSHREGLARVIPQAHAVGKPVISFALDGSLDCIEDGVSGFLTKPHDAAEVAARILELLPDEPRRRAMGEAGRRFAAANFPVEVMVERTNEVYARLMDRRGRRAA